MQSAEDTTSHARGRCSCGIGGVLHLVNSILRNEKPTLRTKAALSCMFAGSTSDGLTQTRSAIRVRRTGLRTLSHPRLVSRFIVVHKSQAYQFTHAPSSLCLDVTHIGLRWFARQPQDTQHTKLCPRHSEALPNRVSAAVASLKMITRTGTTVLRPLTWTNAPQNQSGSSLYAGGIHQCTACTSRLGARDTAGGTSVNRRRQIRRLSKRSASLE